ncbi:MAG TPA: hypothetical protein VKS99_12980, partial [Blastocatellia bacterium]|nr:hypothetical protein [Blastocatellia bacterium]
MLFAQCLGWWLLTLSLGFNSFASTPSQPSSATPAQNSADELAARALTEAFFKTWAAKDLDGFLRLWSAKSPELEPRRKSMQELFNSSEKIELRGLTIQAVKIEGDKARVLVEAEAHVIEAKTGKEKAGFGKTLRTLALVKEDGVWRVANEQSAFDELALSLATAADEQERARLLAANADLPVKGLLEALLAQSRQLRFGGKMREAETLLMAAQAEAEKSGEQRMLVLTWLNLGEYFVSRDDFDHALEVFQRALALAETLGGKAEIAGALRS